MTRDASQDQLSNAARGGAGTRVASASLVSAQDWDAYLSNNPGGAFYHLSGWRSILHDRMGHDSFHLVALNDDQITGVLPLVLVSSRLFGRILVSVPFMNYGGICADNPSVASLLLDTAVQETKNLGADYLEVRSAVPLDTDLPVSLRKVSLTLQLDPESRASLECFFVEAPQQHPPCPKTRARSHMRRRRTAADVL